jgi:hypothetical protein
MWRISSYSYLVVVGTRKLLAVATHGLFHVFSSFFPDNTFLFGRKLLL